MKVYLVIDHEDEGYLVRCIVSSEAEADWIVKNGGGEEYIEFVVGADAKPTVYWSASQSFAADGSGADDPRLARRKAWPWKWWSGPLPGDVPSVGVLNRTSWESPHWYLLVQGTNLDRVRETFYDERCKLVAKLREPA